MNTQRFTQSVPLYSISLHYFYCLFLFFTMAGYGFFVVWSETQRRSIKTILWLAVAVLSLSLVLNGAQTLNFNLVMARNMASLHKYKVAVNEFIRRHGREKNFSCELEWSDQQVWLPLPEGQLYPEQMIKVEYFSTLYNLQYAHRNPIKYYFIYTSDKGLLSFARRDDAVKFRDAFWNSQPNKSLARTLQPMVGVPVPIN